MGFCVKMLYAILTVISPRGKVKGETGRVLLDFNVTGCPVAEKGAVRLDFQLPRHAISLLQLSW